MAQTLRLPAALDQAVEARAGREGISKHAVVVKLVEQHVDDDIADDTVRLAAAGVIARRAAVLDRLANA